MLKVYLRYLQWYAKGVLKVCYRKNQDIVNCKLRYIIYRLFIAEILTGISNAF